MNIKVSPKPTLISNWIANDLSCLSLIVYVTHSVASKIIRSWNFVFTTQAPETPSQCYDSPCFLFRHNLRIEFIAWERSVIRAPQCPRNKRLLEPGGVSQEPQDPASSITTAVLPSQVTLKCHTNICDYRAMISKNPFAGIQVGHIRLCQWNSAFCRRINYSWSLN